MRGSGAVPRLAARSRDSIDGQVPRGDATPGGAAIPVTILVLGHDSRERLQFDWSIPARAQAGSAAATDVPLAFAIDVLGGPASSASLAPGDYVVYVVIGGRVFGPRAVIVPAAR